MASKRPEPPGKRVVRLRIQLADVEPPVWRRLLVPGSVSLAKLHLMFQAAMGWTDSHLHNFQIGDELYGMQFDDHPDDELDEGSVTVSTAVGGQDRFVYEYDFGDGWEHEVVVEDTWRVPTGLKFAVCFDGERACPPEDCGGPWGYAGVLEAQADPSHAEHADVVAWLGGPFDPEVFDLAAANAALQQIR